MFHDVVTEKSAKTLLWRFCAGSRKHASSHEDRPGLNINGVSSQLMLVIEDGGKDSSYMTLFTSKAVIFF